MGARGILHVQTESCHEVQEQQQDHYSCKYHVVWCPKYRRSVLRDGVDVRLKEIILSVVQECKAELIEFEVMPDHVHIVG